jgi:preprotein translocase subunit SecE
MAKKTDEPKPVDDDDEDEEQDDESESKSESEGDEATSDAGEAKEDALARALAEGDEKSDALAEGDAEAEGDGELAAAQLGTDRYVLAGFFASGILAAYVLGRTLQALWVSFSNRDWFNHAVPFLAARTEDEKTSYSFVVAGVAALILIVRVYKRPDVRAWADDVAGELAKVQWPTKKEVYNSTFIVIVASAAATLYLALLDRLWAFVTNIVYGDGS